MQELYSQEIPFDLQLNERTFSSKDFICFFPVVAQEIGVNEESGDVTISSAGQFNIRYSFDNKSFLMSFSQENITFVKE
jgi:hypothetical protein